LKVFAVQILMFALFTAPSLRAEDEPVPFRGSLATPFSTTPLEFRKDESLVGAFKEWAHGKVMVVGDYLYQGFSTAGLGFVYRRPTEEELKEIEKPWQDSWHKKLPAYEYNLNSTFEHIWPYQFPVRLVTRLSSGEQHLMTPGIGLADALNRATCSTVAQNITGKFVMTLPAKFVVSLGPSLVGIHYLIKAANTGQAHWKEHQLQGPQAEYLDREIANNLLLKPVRMALSRKEEPISREHARRLADVLLRESEGYVQAVQEAWPSDPKDPLALEALVYWSLERRAFEDLAALAEDPRLPVDPEHYLYDKNFDRVASDAQIFQLVMNRHATLLRVAGVEGLLNEVTQRIPGLEVDPAGEEVRESVAAQKILESFRNGKIDETTARKYLHIYLDFDQEIKQGRVLGYYKRAEAVDAKGNKYLSDIPLTIQRVEELIIKRLP